MKVAVIMRFVLQFINVLLMSLSYQFKNNKRICCGRGTARHTCQ